MISEQDQELIRQAGKESLGLSDNSGHYVSKAVVKNPDLFEAYASNGEIADIGCSETGPGQARYFLDVPSIRLVHLVDPKVKEGRLTGFDPGTMRFHQKDGLQFLLEQIDVGQQMNVKTSSIEEEVIGGRGSGLGTKYLERLAEVIHDIVPEDGFYVASASETLQVSALRLFPIHLELGTDTHLYLKRKQTGYTRLIIEAKQIENEFASADAMLSMGITYREGYSLNDGPLTKFREVYFFYKALVESNNPVLSGKECEEIVDRIDLETFDPKRLISDASQMIEKLKAMGDERVAQFYLRGIERIRDSVEKNLEHLQRANATYERLYGN